MKNTQIDEGLTLKTIYGNLTAKKEQSTLRFENIRYAQSFRYGLPESVALEDAFSNRPEKPMVSPQPVYPVLDRMIAPTDPEEFIVDESPQVLTVTVPENFKSQQKIPVVFWIHGGSYEIGAGDLPTSSPVRWVREQNIIVVAVTYRLGIFGFLGGSEKRPANLGLFDIIEALKWVNRYIQLFNGDPENITLLGQSSGGDAVAHMMLVDLQENLFQKVIIQSAPLGLRHSRQKMAAEFLRKTEVFEDEKNVLKLVEKCRNLYPSIRKYRWPALMPFGIQYGHAPMCAEDQADEVWKNNAKRYKVLIGLNHDETSFYAATSNRLMSFSTKSFPGKMIKKLIRFSTEKIYGKPADAFSKNLAKGGGSGYSFRILGMPDSRLGAPHCYDLPLLFGDFNSWRNAEFLNDTPWEDLEIRGIRLRELWAGFARSGKVPESGIPNFLEVKAF